MATVTMAMRYRIVARSAGDRRQLLGEGGDGYYYLLRIERGGIEATRVDTAAAHKMQFSAAWHPVRDRNRVSSAELVSQAARM